MAKDKTKKMTLTYWKGLSKDSKFRALTYVFPLEASLVRMLQNEKPQPKQSPWWQLVWKKVRIPADHSHYKTVVNDTYIC